MTNTPLSPELRELLAKATGGPWAWQWAVAANGHSDGRVYSEWRGLNGTHYCVAVSPRYQNKERWSADAALIVKLFNAAPALLALAPQSLEREGDDRETCQCSRCGRLHRKLSTLPTSIGGELSHKQLCRLSILFGREADININQPDYHINEWLKAKLSQAALAQQPPAGETE